MSMSENASVITWYLLPVLALLTSAATGFSLYAVLIAYVRWKYSHLPSPKTASFFLGHAYELDQFKRRGNGENPLDEQFVQWAYEVGNVYVLFFHWRAMVIVLNPADVETVCTSLLHGKTAIVNHFAYLFGERLMGRGLFTLHNYEEWKPRRRLYESAFHPSHLKRLLPKFCKSVDLFLDKLTPLADGRTKVPMKIHMSDAMLDVISKVMFSSDFTTKWRGKCSTVKEQGLGSLTEQAFKGIEISRRHPLFKFMHPYQAEHYREVARALRVIGRNCIQSRVKALENGEVIPLDILSHILKMASSNESADIETLVDDFVTFYIGGLEATANTLLFAVVQVHQHPEVLKRLLTEIKEVLGDKENVTAEDLDKLKYTEQVIEETMRLPGIVGGSSRKCPAGGVTLSGHHIPAGTTMVTHTGAMCKMPQYFDNPYTFNPSRFDPANKRPSPYVYFPFSVGHRSCLAKHFAMMEAKLILARLVQTFEVTLPHGYKLNIVERTTKYPADDVKCTLLSRYQ